MHDVDNYVSDCAVVVTLTLDTGRKGHATRNDIVDDIVDFSSSTMAFNVAKIASARASLTKSLRVAEALLSRTVGSDTGNGRALLLASTGQSQQIRVRSLFTATSIYGA